MDKGRKRNSQLTKEEEIWRRSLTELVRKNRRKLTKSGSVVATVRAVKVGCGCHKFRFKPFFFANWTILSDLEQKNFFSKINFLIFAPAGWKLTINTPSAGGKN